ncbi:MAG: acyl-CoA dehydrogenase family protein, partial [Acidimicrobiales bacterium]
MEIGYTEEQRELRRELRDYYTNLLTPEVEQELSQSHGIGAAPRRITKQMASDGWLGIGWPTQWGGQGRSAVEQFIFFDESMRSGAPVPMLTINTVGPTIMNYGSDEQKEFFLPKILAGEIHFCIGYSEPNAGTDLAALQSRAVVDGDELVINAAKIFTSLAGDADYCWLAVRTDPEAPKHKGISMVIVPMDAAGVRVVPMNLLGEHNINYTFWEDVRVPVTNVVGGLNNGWSLITNQLNHERVTLCSPGIIERALGDVRAWAQETNLADGRRVIDQEWVQIHLARVYAKLEFLKLVNWKVAWQGTQGRLDVADASSIKVFGTEFYMEALHTLQEILGQAGYLKRGSPGAILK